MMSLRSGAALFAAGVLALSAGFATYYLTGANSSLQLSEAVLTDMGIAVGPVIASIHEKRDELRKEIKNAAGIERAPRFRRLRERDQDRQA